MRWDRRPICLVGEHMEEVMFIEDGGGQDVASNTRMFNCRNFRSTEIMWGFPRQPPDALPLSPLLLPEPSLGHPQGLQQRESPCEAPHPP